MAAPPVLDVAPAWAGAAGRSALTGLAVVLDPDAASVAWVPADVPRGPRRAVRARPTAARCGPTRPRRCMRGLAGARRRRARRCSSTRPSPPTCSTRPRPATRSADLLGRYTGDSLPDRRRARRPARPRRRGAPTRRSARPARRWPSAAWPRRSSPPSTSRACATLYDEIENPLVARAGPHGGGRRRRRRWRSCDGSTTASPPSAHRLAGEVYGAAGREFNLNSTMQLRQILFDELGLTPQKRTKTGFSTDAASLEKLRDQWPEFIDPLLSYREVEKLRSTYGEGLLAEVAPDGRIHATFNQTVARTGRLSSDQPNLHNIPVRSEEGRQFRRAFVPAPGHELLVADYNQIELRCIAHLAEDPGLIGGVHRAARTSTPRRRRGSSASSRAPSPSSSGRRRRWCPTAWPTAWRPTGWGSGSTSPPTRRPRSSTAYFDRVPEREGLHGPHGDRGPQAGLHRDAVRAAPADPRAVSRRTGASARRASARR